jgi:protoporphyrinogen oxidase
MTKNIAIVGGGIVGLATAYKLQKRMPNVKVTPI